MTEYLYRIQPTRPEMLSDGGTPRENEIIQAHFDYLEALAADGTVTLAGRTLNADPTAFGIVLLNADEASARSIVDNDPAVAQGVMRAELFPFRTALRGAT
ncbi:MAG: hypothetical protein E2O54_10250 [Gammaproteobacteria bacterium]|nr:MAG: hypothetical protein E2O58_00020 [Gammaproteobacteria bacterium]TDJ39562.1 MAG: hypothetical protein E2O54_10250 [Gammaproteobacteria bacterium]